MGKFKAAGHAAMAASSGAEAVKVVVRCRPMNKQEKIDTRTKVVKVTPKKGTIEITDPANDGEDPKGYTFDAVYDWDCRQRDVYDETAHPLIEQVLEGYNGTIFAYGQTGCGKSFTMMGLHDPPEMRGACLLSPSCLSPLSTDVQSRRYYSKCLRPHIQPHFAELRQGIPDSCVLFGGLQRGDP
jgi:hypothetical protein